MKLLIHIVLACVLIWNVGFFPGWFDSGEFSTAVSVLGVSHPGGHALYVLLAKILALAPLGTMDFRMSCFSAFCTLVASWFLWTLAVEISWGRSKWIGAAASLGYVFHPSVMLQAVRTEVYALYGALSIACIGLALLWVRRGDARISLSLALLLGALTALHPLLALTIVAPLVLLAVLKTATRRPSEIAGWIPWFVLGAALNLYVPLRASRHPVLNWDSPSTWKALTAFGSARDYSHFMHSPLGLPSGFVSLLFGTEGIWPLSLLILALAGVLLLFRTRRAEAVLLMTMCFVTSLPLFRSDFHIQNPDVHAYLLIPVALSVLLAAIGAESCGILLGIAERKCNVFAFILTTVTLIWILPTGWQVLRGNASAEAEALASHLDLAPQNSALLVESDHWLFPLWYRAYVEKRRPDVAVISPRLLKARWYRDQVLERYGILFERRLFRENGLPTDRARFGFLASDEPVAEDPTPDFLTACRRRFQDPDPFQIRRSICGYVILTTAHQDVRSKKAIRAARLLENVLAVPAGRGVCDVPKAVDLPFPLLQRPSAFLADPQSPEDMLGLLYLGCGDGNALIDLAKDREDRNMNLRLMHAYVLLQRGERTAAKVLLDPLGR